MTFDDAHKTVDAWLTEEGKRGLKGEAETDATLRRAIETVLRTALDKAEPIITCRHCGEPIEHDPYNESVWLDAGSLATAALVFCTDQDETHDGVRHEPA